MRKSFLSFFSLSLLLLTCSATRSEFDRFNKCQLNNINALEPDHRVESEAGLTETWNPNHPELQCAGVSLIRRTIDPNGLHLPSFSPSPQLIFITQGIGFLGLSIPGCPETYEEEQSQSRQGSGQQQQEPDSHQQIRRISKGDVIAIPSGIPYWTYNHCEEPLVAISLLDTSNFGNQLDSTPRVFYLGGNPDVEFRDTQQQGHHRQRHSFPGEHTGGQHQKEEESEEQNEGNSVLSGFSSEFLAKALNTDQDTAKRLQSPRNQRSQIVRVEGGLHIITPDLQEEEPSLYTEGEEGDRKKGCSPSHRRKEKEEQRPRHSRHGEEEEQEPRRSEEEEERCDRRSCRGKERKNGLEETMCSAKIHVSSAYNPARADFYNPRAGHISLVNSLTLPILRKLRLSAEYVVLYRNGIYAPHWTMNANSLMYVTRGEGRVRIVNCQGNAVFDDRVRKGQLVVVPQNFVVAQQAGEEERFEYVVFKTNDRASVSHVKQVFRATPAAVLANAFGLPQREVSELKHSGSHGPLIHPQSQSQ